MQKPGLYWWVAPFYKLLLPASQIIREWTPHEFIVKRYEQQNVIRYLQLPNKSEIYLHSADRADTLRGSGLYGLVIDEAPSMREARWKEELRPSLMDKRGWAIFIGTPKGRNWYHRLYLRGKDRDAWPDWESWRYPSHENPYLHPQELENAKHDLPELTYRQEILAEFLAGEGTVFRNVDDLIAGALGPAESERRYNKGCDLAKTQDFTVLIALDEYGHLRGFDRFRQIDWTFQKKRIKLFDSQYPGIMWIDSSGVGDPIFEDLRRDGVRVRGYKFTSESKRQLIENLSIGMDALKYTYPEELVVLRNELKAFGYEMTPTGNIRYSAPEGLHDDCVISFALAAWGLRGGRPSGRLGVVR